MPYFTKRPQIIEARQFTGTNQEELLKWLKERAPIDTSYILNDTLMLDTFAGYQSPRKDDWIVIHPRYGASLYRSDVFEKLYQPYNTEDSTNV